MRASIQIKLLILCILLVLLTTVGISSTYYLLTKRDKHRESQQRILIAFEIILDDFTRRFQDYAQKFDTFLQRDESIYYLAVNVTARELKRMQYHLVPRLADLSFITSADRLAMYGTQEHFEITAQTLENLHHEGIPDDIITGLTPIEDQKFLEEQKFVKAVEEHIGTEQILLYKDLLLKHSRVHRRVLMAVYERPDDQKTADIQKDVEAEPAHDSGSDQLSSAAIPPTFEGTIPENTSVEIFREEQKLGIRVITPISGNVGTVGVLVGHMSFTQSMVEHYGTLSKTEVNFFAGNQLSIGTLQEQSQLEPDIMDQLVSCEELLNQADGINLRSVSMSEQEYYQGHCTLKNAQDTVGAITVSLSQEIEKQEIRKIITTVFAISGIAIVVAVGLSLLGSRKPIQAIQNIVREIEAAAEGDLRPKVIVVSHDEIGILARRLNQMISQLRTISGQVQTSSYAVNGTADTILQQIDSLIRHMEQQSTSVDTTTMSVEKINHFIDAVAQNTADLLTTAALILSSIQQTRASINEVTTSTGSLTSSLHLISASVDQVNQSVKQIAENTGKLEESARQTETEIYHIDQSLKEVSHNANQAQQSAQKTMHAVTSGQASVEASMQGILELKEVVTNTAQIIQEVNSWGEQVSSILDIVDEIAEQTALLSLNASIISAQAGVHGRGFAVVAEEIKELATRTKTSTQKIATLVRTLQQKTGEGVKKTEEGIIKAEQGVRLASAVKEALNTILEEATHSLNRAADTVHVIQQTADSSQIISSSMNRVTERASHIRKAIQEEEQDIEQVVSAVENISGMAEQVSRASFEQQRAAKQIAKSMEEATERFSGISDQTELLRQDSNQILAAMHTIENVTENITQNAMAISEDTVKNLIQQSEALQKIVRVFKVS